MDCEKGFGSKGGNVAFMVAEAVTDEEKQAPPANPQESKSSVSGLMDCEKGVGNAGCKGGNVAFKVAEAVRVEEKQQALPANPQIYPYLVFLFLAANVLSFELTIGPSLSQNNDSPFEAYDGVFMIMAVSFFLVVLASGALIFTSTYLQRWMKDIHYVILKSVGCFSTINGIFSLWAVFLDPKDLYVDVYLVMASVFVCILTIDYFLWKYVCMLQQNKLCNTCPFDHWAVFVIPALPLSLALGRFIPPNFQSIWYLVKWGSFWWVLVSVLCSLFSFEAVATVSNLEPLAKSVNPEDEVSLI